MILPSKQPTQSTANNRGDEPIPMLVVFDYRHRLFFTEKTVRRGEMLRTDRDFFVGLCLNVANPVRIGTESIDYYNLGTFFAVVDDFEHGLTPQAGAPASMSQKQATFSK
jgi:hypothetical protein